MKTCKVHTDEIDIDFHLVRKLLTAQFPDWANLELQLIHPEGTDNVMYKLGNDKVVRIQRTEGSATNVKKECIWLPYLAPLLPIAIPTLLAEGKRVADYNLPWYICQFLEGKNPNAETMIDHHQTAIDLGNFISTMQKIDSKNGPKCRRGQPLSTRDQETRKAINLLSYT